jgi:hypothetical protein
MMMADNISGTFGQVPNQAQTRPLINVPRKQTVGFDVSQVPIANPNGGFIMPITQLPKNELPAAFGGMGGGNTLLAAQQFQATVVPKQSILGSGTPTFKFASTEGQVVADAKGGVGNMNREQAKKQAGVASDDVVSGSGAIYTG